MHPIPERHPLKQLFTGLVEHAFYTELGICDPALSDYVSDLMIDFVHVDRLSLAKELGGQSVGEIGEILAKWELDDEDPRELRDRRVHRLIGDYALFWTGVYPEMIQTRPGLSGADRMRYFTSYGKRSYAIASDLTDGEERPPADLLRRLSDDFEFCAHGLGIVRRDLEQSPPRGDSGLIY